MSWQQQRLVVVGAAVLIVGGMYWWSLGWPVEDVSEQAPAQLPRADHATGTDALGDR